MKINKYNISLRLVEEQDANFIISIRNDDKKARFISRTYPHVELQKKWIKEYKKREKNGEEFYFIATDGNNEDFATYRIYKIESGLPEIGSWVSKPNYSNPLNSLKVDVIIKNYVFDELGFDKLQFEVRKLNHSVVKYHQMFSPVKVSEDKKNNYYTLEKEIFLTKLNQIENKFKFKS